jgi:hypothetical protein
MIDKKKLEDIVSEFDTSGEVFFAGKRNVIKIFDFQGVKLNIKAFKKPIFINQIVYKYFRPSKAKRSFDYGNYLIENGFLTPKPFGFFEKFDFIGLTKSYYCSQHLENATTIGNIFFDKNTPDRVIIIQGYARYFFELHEKGIEFLDNSLGNTLVVKENNQYKFYLVDLNRMNLNKKMNAEQRMNNFSRLTLDTDVLKIISDEYSKKYFEISSQQLNSLIVAGTMKFHHGLARKKQLKKLNFFNLNDLDILQK